MSAAASSAQQFDPAYRFNVLPTEHFRIYFHEGEEALAARLAPIAEETWHRLDAALGEAPERTYVVLVDQADLANGWATPFPRNVIAIHAAWPAGSDSLVSDDWLRLVFTHEFTHIVHLDRAAGWARIVRRIFGRTPLGFPNLFLPAWQIEGLAVYEESALTGTGRMHAGDFRAIVHEAARAERLLPLDRVNGGLTRWPAGQAAYAYGLDFHKFLADRYGAETLSDLTARTAGSLPYLGSLSFRKVYGKSLGDLWSEYEASVRASLEIEAPVQAGTRLTHHEFIALGPSFAPPACVGCAAEIYYSVRNADELPSLYRLPFDAARPAEPERVAVRYLGSTVGAGRDRIYFDQRERRRNAGLYSDLYSFDRASREVRRLTREARLIDPDLSPDGRTIAAARIRPGQRELVLVHLAGPDSVSGILMLVSETETQFNTPRWSPDGRTLVVERQRLGALPELVLVDVATDGMTTLAGPVTTLASDPDTRWATPAWHPNGRSVIAAAAVGDRPFDLYEIDLATRQVRRLTETTGGALWPAVSPDGTSIVYVGYTASGFDLFSMPYPRVPGFRGSEVPRFGGAGSLLTSRTPEPRNPGTSEPISYSPWSTLAPTWWSPLVTTSDRHGGVGAATSGVDVLGYHGYAASFTKWIGATESDAFRTPRLDWRFSYAYARWVPAVFASISRETTYFREPDQMEPRAFRGAPNALARWGARSGVEQDTHLAVGVVVPVSRVRWTQTVTASWVRGRTRRVTGEEDLAGDEGAARLGWSYRSAREFGNSISLEDGVIAGATAELARQAFGSAADATVATGDVRAYLPGLGRHHVVAVRAAAGRSSGDRVVGRVFRLGGPGPDLGPIDFGSNAVSVLRGFASSTFAGTRVAVVNADYRLPLLRIERGVGTWPIFVHTLHAAVFADAGHAWSGAFAASDIKSSFGAEISANLVVGFWAPITIAAGAARGRDGGGRVPDQTTWYGRVGYAF